MQNNIHERDAPVVIEVRCADSDGFLMVFNLCRLLDMGNAEIRKLFRMMNRLPYENEDAIRQTGDWLEKYVETTRFVYEQVQRENQREHVNVPPRSRRPEDAAARQRNKELEAAERQAKQDYNRAVRLQTYFNSERKL